MNVLKGETSARTKSRSGGMNGANVRHLGRRRRRRRRRRRPRGKKNVFQNVLSFN